MAQALIVKAKGLYTQANGLASIPEGTFSVARNVVIDKDDVVESRRGFTKTAALPSVGSRIDAAASFQTSIIAHRSNDNVLCSFNGTSWLDYAGTYAHPDSSLARMKFVDMSGNKYFTTANGVSVLNSPAGPVYSTGVPQSLDGTGATSGVSGWMTTNTQVAYRIVWGSTDSNQNLYLGSPSQRLIVANASGSAANVQIKFTIPAGITTSNFYQVYRSAMSATSTTEPNDELQLVYEANPTGTDITNKYFQLTDVTPDSLKGAYLYTNASQEGIAQTNDVPPFASDIATFNGYMFFAAVKTKHVLNFKMISVGASLGLVNGDTITVDGVTYTGQSTENAATGQFLITSGGTAAQNIDATARSLVRVINQYASNTTVYAFYTTGYASLPGQIMIQRRNLSAGSFTISVSRATAWDIAQTTSSNQSFPHGFMWSKSQQPEHVPTSNMAFVGAKNSPIRRILALKQSLVFLKDDGIFLLTGSGGNWTVVPLDTSTHIVAPESAVVLNNLIYAFTDQGVVTISDIGVAVISRPIEDLLQNVLGANLTTVQNLSFGVSYETDRKYILYTISTANDSYPTQAFVYNTFTRAWTIWDKPALFGVVHKSDGLLYIAMPDDQYLLKERKTYSYRDFIDEEMSGYSISAFSGAIVTLNTTAGLTIGDLFSQGSTVSSPIVAINSAANQVTMNDPRTWTIASVTVNRAIAALVEWNPLVGGNAGLMKHWSEVAFLFRQQSFVRASGSFATEVSAGYQASTLAGAFGTGAWGSAAWGSDLWGGALRPRPLRVLVPREKSRSTQLAIRFECRQAYSLFALEGLSVQFDSVSERFNRA